MLKTIAFHAERYVQSVDVRTLGRRYFCAALLILAAVTTSHVTALVEVGKSADDAEIINESGRQRMLNQRILNLANQVASNAPELTISRLNTSIDEFETAHLSLSRLKKNNDVLRALYFNGPQSIDVLVKQFIADARSIANAHQLTAETLAALARMNAIGTDVLLSKLNQAVVTYEEIAKTNAKNLRYIKLGSLLLVVLVLALEAVFIFWPAHLAAIRAIGDREKRLKTARENAALSAEELVRLRM